MFLYNWLIHSMIFSFSYAWNKPNPNFIYDFADAHDRTSIVLHLPEKVPNTWVKKFINKK